jgi:O-antigen ligase
MTGSRHAATVGARFRPMPARYDLAGLARLVEPNVTALAIFLAPMRWFRLSAFFFTLSDMVFCLSLLLLLAGRRLPKAPLGPMTPLWLGGFTLLAIGLLGSSLLQGSPVRGLIVTGQYVFAWVLLCFVLLDRDPATLRKFLLAFVASIAVSEGIGVAVYFSGWDPTGRIVSGNERLMSFLEDPNANANMIGLTLPIVIYLWLAGILSSRLTVIILPLLLTALILTSSVGGIAIAGLGTSLFLVATMNLRVLARIVVPGVVALGLLLVWGTDYLPKTFQRRVLSAFESGELTQAGTADARLMLIREAAIMIDRNPLVGVGADQFREVSEGGAPVHNAYLIVWAEGGLVALAGWLLLLATVFIMAIAAYQATRRRLTLATTMAVASVFCLIAVNNAHMYSRMWVVPLCLIMALCLASMRAGEDRLGGGGG